MGETLAVFNQKGGVGKTTTVINTGSILAEMGKKIAIVDADPQSNTTAGLGVNEEELERNLYNVLMGECSIKDIIIRTKYGVDLIPSGISLANAEITLSSMINREMVLSRKLQEIQEMYDFIFIDCPPSVGLLSINGLAASDRVIVPLNPAFFTVQGTKYLFNTITLVQDNLKSSLELMGVLLTKFDARTSGAKKTKNDLKKTLGDYLFKTIIRNNVEIEYAQDNQKPINFHKKDSPGCEDYEKFAREVLRHVG